MKQMLKELITGGGIEDEACLRLFSEQKAIRLILFSVRDGEDKEYAQGVESIADEVLNGAVIASVRHLEALLLVADAKNTYIVSGNGDVIEPDEEVAAIGSGGPFRHCRRPRRCCRTPSWARAKSSKKAMKIAGKICIYTNENVTYEELG